MVEIDIDGPIGYSRLVCDFRHLGVIEALFGKYLRGSIYYPFVFFVVFMPHTSQHHREKGCYFMLSNMNEDSFFNKTCYNGHQVQGPRAKILVHLRGRGRHLAERRRVAGAGQIL